MKSPFPPLLSREAAFQKLDAVGEKHLVAGWEELSASQKRELLRQITDLDPIFLKRQQAELTSPQTQPLPPLRSFPGIATSAPSRKVHGAAVILAGGQGSRLRFKGPKGCFPISKVKKKSLFQLVAEKTHAASLLVKTPLPLAIMTSPLTHEEIQSYFAKHKFFGLEPSQVSFFAQEMWPLLDTSGHLFLESSARIAWGPNGNGGVFKGLMEAGIWERWKQEGVEVVNVFPIDNPLALPFDFELMSFHLHHGLDVGLRVAKPTHEKEKVGLLVEIEKRPAIIEYSELGGSLPAEVWGNLGLYSFSLDFIKSASKIQFPLHKAKKSAKRAREPLPFEPNAWKFEEFLFDVLPKASSCMALLSPREATFAPLKNSEGQDSMEKVQEAITAHERKLYYEVSGESVPEGAHFELAPAFYYPSESLKMRWRGKPFPSKEYIDG